MFGLQYHLTRRLLVYITGSIAVALLISIATQFWALQPILEQTRNRSVNAAIENISSLITQSLWVFNNDAFVEASQALLRDQFISGIVVNDHTGNFSYRGGDLADHSELLSELEATQTLETAEALIITVPLKALVDDNGKFFNIGTLQIRCDNDLIRHQVNELAKVTLMVSTVIILTLQVFFYFIVHRIISKPLELITADVQLFASDLDPNVSLDTPKLLDRKDEIGRLYQVFRNQRQELMTQDQKLREHRDQLEQTVTDRTSELRDTNETLVESLEQLKHAQTELIQNEKLVSLGTLVSGIAHEVNTPLGIAITASSHLAEELRQIKTQIGDGKLTKSGLDSFMLECEEAENLLSKNLQRAASLIRSFKKVAVDQSSDQERDINLKSYLDDIVLSLRPKLKHTDITVLNNVPSSIDLSLAPGALAQIVTNLIINSIVHAFDNGKNEGQIIINAELSGDLLKLTYEDNGKGMDETTLNRVYDPFFTTARSEGGSGLGMNIVYNLVTSKLNGSIETHSTFGNGIKITMTIKY